MPWRRLALLLLALPLAGCNAPPAQDEAPEPTRTASMGPFAPEVVNGTGPGGWQIVVPGPACGSFCEPVVAVDSQGRVFVKGITYARSTANGSFETFEPPAVPVGYPVGGFHTDRHLQVAPDGALWFHSLIGANQGAFLLLGVQVARSSDGGDTWTSSYLPLDGAVPTQSLGADRQWMAFAQDGTAYVSFQQNSVANSFAAVPVGEPNLANIWVARSDDDGATWTRFSPVDGVDPTADQATGQPIVDAADQLLVPFHRYVLTDEGAHPAGFAIAVSPDGAAATQHHVSLDGTMFPALAQLPDGRLLAAHNAFGTLRWGMASDASGPWDLVALGTEGKALSSPWVGVRADGAWDLVWMEGDGQGTFDVLHSAAGAPPTTLITGLTGGPGLRANTDFVHAAYLDGRLLVVTSDGEAGQALLLHEPAP